MTLEDELRTAIAKNLPEELGKNLRFRFEQAEKEREQLRVLEDQHKILTKNHATLKDDYDRVIKLNGAWASRQTDLEKREAAVKERESKMDLCDLKVEEAQNTVTHIKDVVSLVFQNNHYKYRRSSNVPVVTPGHKGQYNDVMPGVGTYTETEEGETVG